MAKQGRSKSGGDQSVNLDFLRKAMEWVFDESIFGNLKKHGNANWVAKPLAMLAVLWVWSNNPCLTGAFQEASTWSKQLFGSLAVNSYQVLTTALVTSYAEVDVIQLGYTSVSNHGRLVGCGSREEICSFHRGIDLFP